MTSLSDNDFSWRTGLRADMGDYIAVLFYLGDMNVKLCSFMNGLMKQFSG
jgi:hypothetical protein